MWRAIASSSRMQVAIPGALAGATFVAQSSGVPCYGPYGSSARCDERKSTQGSTANRASTSGVEVAWPHGITLEQALERPRPQRVRELWPPASGTNNWLEAGKIWYRAAGENQSEKMWEMVRRVKANTAPDGTPLEAADVLALVRRSGREAAIVLILLYRPPVDAWSVELPAGMVDAGETAIEAGVRELQEETGFTASANHGIFGLCYPDPWKSTESYVTINVDVDGDLDCNKRPNPKHEQDEHFAAVLLVDLSAMPKVLKLLEQTHGCKIEARTLGIAQGLAVAKLAGGCVVE